MQKDLAPIAPILEWTEFIAAHPQITALDAFIVDVNGNALGKRVQVEDAPGVFADAGRTGRAWHFRPAQSMEGRTSASAVRHGVAGSRSHPGAAIRTASRCRFKARCAWRRGPSCPWRR